MKKNIIRHFSSLNVLCTLIAAVSLFTLVALFTGCKPNITSGETEISCETYNGKPMLSVTPRSDGLYIEKNHSPEWIYISVCVFDVTDNIENARITTNQLENKFLYPFVKSGHEYKVYLTKQEDGYKNWGSTYDDAVQVESIGGIGNFRITYSGYEYYSPDFSIIFKDFSIVSPKLSGIKAKVAGNVCDNGLWSGNQTWSDGFELNGSTLSMKNIKMFLLGKTQIFVVLNYCFSYNNLNYECTIIENRDNYFVDTNNAYTPGKTGLPNVYIWTNDKSEIQKDYWKDGFVKIQDEDGNVLLEENTAQLKGRGNSTWGTGKNPYTFKLEKKQEILDMKSHKRWVLMANYYDRAMIRNRFSGYLGTELYNTTWNASFTPVNLYVNGIYNGTYDLGEQIKINKNRVNIQSMEDYGTSSYSDVNGDGQINIYDGGFIAEIDYRLGETFNFETKKCKLPVNLRDPDELTPEQFEYAKSILNNFETALYSSDFDKTSSKNYYGNFINVDSFVDWWIVNEFAHNTDSIFQTSVYFYYNPADGKLYMGPNWDFDLGYGNDWDDWATGEWYIWGNKKENTEYYGYGRKYFTADWINRLFESSSFKSAAKKRWMEKSSDFNSAINTKIQQYADEIAPSIPSNEELLPRIGQYSWNGPASYAEHTTYQSEIDYMKNWCQKRYNWMNSQIRNW